MAIFKRLSPGLLAFLPIVAAAPAESAPKTGFKQCVQLSVPVPVVATNKIYKVPRIDSTIDSIEWAINSTGRGAPEGDETVIGEKPIDETFHISAQLCVPTQKGPKAGTLHIATPGLAYDKRYWDVEVHPEDYSYVDAAVKAGYSVLAYDRLGTGLSDIPDAYEVMQVPTEVEVLAGLTKIARGGKLVSSSKVVSGVSTLTDYTPSKVVHIGHAFGSYLINIMLARHGELGDAAMLTGFFLNNAGVTFDVSHFDHDFAAEHDPARFGKFPSGYFVLNGPAVLQKLFFKKGSFTPELLAYNERIKVPEAVGEYVSEPTNPLEAANNFTGPVLTMTGEYDYFLCGGPCTGTFDEALTKMFFPSSKVTPYLQPGTGHTLTLSTNATAGYEYMFSYLDSYGL